MIRGLPDALSVWAAASAGNALAVREKATVAAKWAQCIGHGKAKP
jgi:hypothetical protein